MQVPLGSVTPLAAAQPSAQGVVLLLDAGLRGKERIVVHPLSNEASTLLAPAGLEAYLRWASSRTRARVCGCARGRGGAA